MKTTLKPPTLTKEQLAIPFEVVIPDKLLEAQPVTTIVVSAENVIRPEVKVSQS